MSEELHVIHRTCHLSRSTNNIGLVHTVQHSSTYEEANMVSLTSKRQEIDAKQCAVCLRKAKFRCSSCKTVFYCGRPHQMLDWKDHRAACRIRQTFAEIKNAKCHRADLILRKRNHNRSKKLIAMIKEEESLSAFYRKLNRPDFVTTQTLVDEVVQDLTANGFSVIDNFLNTKCMNEVRDDIAVMCSNRGFYPGKLCHTGGGNAVRSVRSDLVRWLDVKHDCEYSAIHMAVRCMDKVASVLNNSRILGGCDIRSRSPAMIAYYPAKSSGYKQHVDNPNKDGRKLTFILYANTEYDQLRHGGMLRIHQKEQRLYFDIEPINGRLVIFWSDSRTPHEVLPTHKDRYAISVWYFDLIERARNFLNLPSNEEQQMLETCSIP